MADIPTRDLGSTGERVSAIGLGGWHLALPHVGATLADRIIRTAIDRGITFLDNCWDYNGGASERRMGKALKGGLRQKVFLMTKIDGRSGKEATRQLTSRCGASRPTASTWCNITRYFATRTRTACSTTTARTRRS